MIYNYIHNYLIMNINTDLPFQNVALQTKFKLNELKDQLNQLKYKCPNIQQRPLPHISSNSKQHTINIDVWTEKYRPTTLDNIVGNTEQIQIIRDWFVKFKQGDTSIKQAILLTGCPGTSKTSVAHAILNEFKYDVIEYNASDVRNKKMVEEHLERLINTDPVDQRFRDNFRPIGIIMDEVDGMSSGDKGGMTQLINLINQTNKLDCVKNNIKRKIPPIICICNIGYDKTINELKKHCLQVKFNKPTIDELCQVITIVITKEGIQITDLAKKLIAERAQGDFRRLMILLQNLTINKKQIDTDDIYDNNIIVSKNIDLNVYEITRLIFENNTTQDILNYYDTDKNLLPMMVHENYISEIDCQSTNNNNKLINIKKCTDAIVNGDMIEKMMYNNQSWYLQKTHGLCSCYLTSYYINTYHKKIHPKIEWTTAFGKFSLQKTNIKNINLLISKMMITGCNYTINDIQTLSQIILFHLLDTNGDVNIGMTYLKNYNLDMHDIEKLIRVDKLSDKYKKLYTVKQKNKLTQLFGSITSKVSTPIIYQVDMSTTTHKEINEEHCDEYDTEICDY